MCAVSFARLKTSFVPFGVLFNKIEIDNDQDNYYWYQLTRSRALTATSARQNYCYHAKLSADSRYEFPAYMPNKEDETNVLRRGDLRLQSVLETEYLIFDGDDIRLANESFEFHLI